MPPQTNAVLKRVEGAGAGESYDGPGGGPEKFDGEVAVYIRDRRDRRRQSEAGDVVLDRVVLVDDDLGVDWRVGDTLTLLRTGGAEDETGKVQVVERRTVDDPEIPADLQTVRLSLEAR